MKAGGVSAIWICDSHTHSLPIGIADYILAKWQLSRDVDVVGKVVGDFSMWDKDAAKYDAALQKLLKALKTENGKT